MKIETSSLKNKKSRDTIRGAYRVSAFIKFFAAYYFLLPKILSR